MKSDKLQIKNLSLTTNFVLVTSKDVAEALATLIPVMKSKAAVVVAGTTNWNHLGEPDK